MPSGIPVLRSFRAQLSALMVECKWADAPLDRGIRYLKARFPRADAWQMSATGTKDYRSPEGVRVAPALSLLKQLV